jgi:hypothetical protein
MAKQPKAQGTRRLGIDMDRVLTWFINGWVGLAIVLLILKVVEASLHASTLWGGIAIGITTLWVWDMFNPFNLRHFIAELIFISPAFGAYLWREKRRNKVEERG